jgi:type I site-specific restriction endonuclease
MALSESMAAYSDCYEHYDRAREATDRSKPGIRILVDDENQARYLQMRMNKARKLEREQSKRTFDRIDHRWNKSENDKFRVRIMPTAESDGKWWVYVEEWVQRIIEVEELE